ncbi:MAG: polysaccharide biosynthesis/export family protein, partial [Bacteroidia bacterium]|nr:polysaccharide biosynthesis/export family protein [Bacteroidia bacterium]
MRILLKSLLLVLILQSCASKKDILYLQDSTANTLQSIQYQKPTVQPNDILKITVESVVPEAAIPYNRNSTGSMPLNNIQLLQLEGYLVSTEGSIGFPVLGAIQVAGQTVSEIEQKIKTLLMDGGHLNT